MDNKPFYAERPIEEILKDHKRDAARRRRAQIADEIITGLAITLGVGTLASCALVVLCGIVWCIRHADVIFRAVWQ